MDKTLRSIIWILIGLVVLSSFSACWFFVAKEKLHNDYINLEELFKSSVERLNNEIASYNKENIKLKTKLETMEKELSILETRNRDFKSRYEELLKDKEDLDRELVRVKKGKFFLEKKLKEMESEEFIAGFLKENVSLGVELKRLKKLVAPKELELERLKKDKNLLEQRLKDSTEVADILSKDLLREKDRNLLSKQEFENMRVENRLLKEKLSESEKYADTLLTKREDLQFKILSLKEEIENRNDQINRLNLALGYRREDELRAEAYHSPDEVDLPPIIVERPERKVAKLTTTKALDRINKREGLQGRIVTVNKEHNFVVIDLGRQDGVDVGTRFDVYRGDILIGSIEAIQTRERIAAADIKNVKEGFFIEVNDVVVKR